MQSNTTVVSIVAIIKATIIIAILGQKTLHRHQVKLYLLACGTVILRQKSRS